MTGNPDIIDEIATRLRPFHGDDDRLGVLLSLCVGRTMLNSKRRGDDDWRSSASDAQIAHVRDWLKAAIAKDEAWLANVDDRGRQRKLLKFATVTDIVAEADRAMLKAVQNGERVSLIEGDEALHATLDDGYYLVRLLTPAALDRESAEMQHCIGGGAYDDLVTDPARLYLSLRAPGGRPHATIEIVDGVITQIQGKQNKPPITGHLERIIPWAKNSGYGVNVPIAHLGYAVDVRGDWHDIRHLPDGLEIGGDMDLSRIQLEKLPNGLKVGGNLRLDNPPFGFLPTGLKVGGDLAINKGLIESLPEGLDVGGNLVLTRVGITRFPEAFAIGGSVRLSDTKISSLPPTLHVRGNLDILGCPRLTGLPPGLRVDGELNVRSTPLEALPLDLAVGDSVILIRTDISWLPENFHVGRDLILSETKIDVLPETLSVGRDLDIGSTNVSVIPAGLRVGRSLKMRGTPVAVWPAGLKAIRGSLDIGHTEITGLPEGLVVGAHLDVAGLSADILPEGLSVGGMINLGDILGAHLPASIADDAVIHSSDTGQTTAAEYRANKAEHSVKERGALRYG